VKKAGDMVLGRDRLPPDIGEALAMIPEESDALQSLIERQERVWQTLNQTPGLR
jgi:hypothetical protein